MTDIAPNKRLSQNFLIDPNISRKIVRKAGLLEKERVLEIGPGLGALTKELLAAGAEVIAIEKDSRCVSHLQKHYPQVTLFEYDFLEFPLETLPQDKKMRVIANLPYNITTPILTSLAPRFSLFSSLVVMVQHEVAERIVAQPGGKAIGAITYFLNFYGKARILFNVSPQAFYPAPSVNSSCLEIVLEQPPPCSSSDHLFTLIRLAFQQRRKMLRASLRGSYPKELLEKSLESLAVDQARPEELSLADFIKLSDLLFYKN